MFRWRQNRERRRLDIVYDNPRAARPRPVPSQAAGMSARDRAYHDLRYRILNGRLAPGTTLLETELAALLGLSREKLDTPERWRDVQKLNHIGNPRHLQPGTTLRMLPGWLKPKVAGRADMGALSGQVKARLNQA